MARDTIVSVSADGTAACGTRSTNLAADLSAPMAGSESKDARRRRGREPKQIT